MFEKPGDPGDQWANSTPASYSPRFSLLQLCISLAAGIVLQHLAAGMGQRRVPILFVHDFPLSWINHNCSVVYSYVYIAHMYIIYVLFLSFPSSLPIGYA